jgi:hypothetical protein
MLKSVLQELSVVTMSIDYLFDPVVMDAIIRARMKKLQQLQEIQTLQQLLVPLLGSVTITLS